MQKRFSLEHWNEIIEIFNLCFIFPVFFLCHSHSGDELESMQPSLYRNVARQLNISVAVENMVSDAFIAVATEILSTGTCSCLGRWQSSPLHLIHCQLDSLGHCGRIWSLRPVYPNKKQSHQTLRFCVWTYPIHLIHLTSLSHSLSHEFVLTHFHWRCFTQTCLIKSESGLTRSQVTLNR